MTNQKGKRLGRKVTLAGQMGSTYAAPLAGTCVCLHGILIGGSNCYTYPPILAMSYPMSLIDWASCQRDEPTMSQHEQKVALELSGGKKGKDMSWPQDHRMRGW